MSNFDITTSIKKLSRLKKRTKVIPGGTSAGKTFGILPQIINKCATDELTEASVVSESIPHLRKGAIRDFLKIMKATGRYIDDHWNRTQLTYSFHNGSFIEFFSAEDESKVRGPRRNILFLNECNNIDFKTYHQLAIRTSDSVWLDYNPSSKFWVHEELKDDPDTDWLTLTYRDNESLSESIINEIEKSKNKAYYDVNGDIFDKKNIKNPYWDNWWKVYGMGLLGTLEGVIFNNWKIISEIPKGAVKIGSGLDFGYTNDPTAIIDIYKYNDKRILDEKCYQTKLTNADIAKILNKYYPTYADSAEPKSIDEIRFTGNYNIYPTKKGRDSILYGIQIMQNQDYLVTANSTNLIKELRNYCWDKDKTGKLLNKPIDLYNHLIDALRYHEMMTLSQHEQWTQFVF